MQKSILVIEDELPIQKIFKEKLEEAGYKVSQSFDGKEGIDTALLLKPDMILLDIIMPVMDGVEVLRRLRSADWGKNAKVIVLSNLTMPIEPLDQLNVSKLLLKTDWSLDQLIEMIKKEVPPSE